MALLTTTNLQTHMGLSAVPNGAAASIDSAELLISDAIGIRTEGTTPLVEQTVVEKIIPARDRRHLEVTKGPIVSITSVTYNDGDDSITTPEFNDGEWRIGGRASDGNVVTFSRSIEYTATYLVGWTDLSTLPQSIRQAVLYTAEAMLEGAGRGIGAQSIGDYSRAFVDAGAIPPAASRLVQRYRRPMI